MKKQIAQSPTEKLAEMLMKFKPYMMKSDRGILWIHGGNGLQLGSIRTAFPGYGDAQTILNIAWNGAKTETAKEDIERLTNGEYTIDVYKHENEPFAKINK